jgi:hypothetical protein
MGAATRPASVRPWSLTVLTPEVPWTPNVPKAPSKPEAIPPPDIAGFLDQCRQIQAQAANLCQDGSGLSIGARDALKDLRLALLKARKMLGQSADVGGDPTLETPAEGTNRSPQG